MTVCGGDTGAGSYTTAGARWLCTHPAKVAVSKTPMKILNGNLIKSTPGHDMPTLVLYELDIRRASWCLPESSLRLSPCLHQNHGPFDIHSGRWLPGLAKRATLRVYIFSYIYTVYGFFYCRIAAQA